MKADRTILEVGQEFLELTVTSALLDEMVENFDEVGLPVLATAGLTWAGFDVVEPQSPMIGWCSGLRREGDRLVATVEYLMDSHESALAAHEALAPTFLPQSMDAEGRPQGGRLLMLSPIPRPVEFVDYRIPAEKWEPLLRKAPERAVGCDVGQFAGDV